MPRRPATPTGAVPSGRPYAVVDIDGVVADVRHRLHFLERAPKDWAGFFAAASEDPVLPEGAAAASRLALDHDLVWLTGRPESCRGATAAWLEAADLPEGRLLMRARRDFRPARVTKVATLGELARDRAVAVLVDDDAQVVAAARAAGFLVLHADWMPPAASLAAAQERDGRT